MLDVLLPAYQLLNSGLGRTLVLCLALAGLLAIMATDRRSLAEYGLTVRPGWWRQLGAGLLVGSFVYGAYCGFACILGVFQWNTSQLNAYRWFSAGLAASCAIPVAATQQIIFSGYLLSRFRESIGRDAAVVAAAATFAVLASCGDSSHWFSQETVRLASGLFLIAALLGILRLITGNILLPIGVLAGAIAVRRLIKKTHLFVLEEDHAWTNWFAPQADPRQGVWFWSIVALGLVAAWIFLRRRGEPEMVTNQPLLTASFKRVFPFSNVMALAPLDLWWSNLLAARFEIGLKYVPRLAWILTASTLNTLLSLPERWLAPFVLRHRVADPVCIVGVHRSGTTHLHNLLALDPKFCTPRNYHTMNPLGAWITGWCITPLLGLFMTMKRPMDAMSISMWTPQEDEFALAGMGRLSPYWGFTFPRSVNKHDRYIFSDDWSDEEQTTWKNQLLLFLRKVTFWSRKRPLLKSPYHTGRIPLIRSLFNDAKIIHIVRHPHDVFRSNQHLAREGLITFQLQDPDPEDCFETRFVANYRRLMDQFYDATKNLPGGNVVEVRFEDLEQDPFREVQRIYRELNMDFSDAFAHNLRRYIASVAEHRKNRFATLPAEEQRLIEREMTLYMHRWGYVEQEPLRSTDVAPAA